MSTYMLNLTFDPNDQTEANEGRFLEYDDRKPLLRRSKVWLNATVTYPDPDTESDWELLEADTDLFTLGYNDQVFIRVSPTAQVSGYTARLTAIVARNASRASHRPDSWPHQAIASPFALPGTQQCCTIFDTVDPAFQPPNGRDSWYFQLPPVTLRTRRPRGAPPAFHDSYSVTVSVSVSGSNDFFATYSHDPHVDVSC
jgi:hypothetical protein